MCIYETAGVVKRASVYILASGVIWFAEGYLFSRFLAFSAWQTVLLASFYGLLFAWSVRALRGGLVQPPTGSEEMAAWRLLSLTPMLTTILGSFVSLPLVLLVLALGRLG